MSDSWVGGDIAGLGAMGTAYTGAKKSLEGVVKPLGGQADKLVDDAGWQGEAAESFREAWTADSMAAGALAELVGAVGKVLTDLSTRLSTAETGLQNAEDVAVQAGVPMGPAGAPGELMTNNPPNPEESKAIKALDDYAGVRATALHEAQQARLDAADALTTLYGEATGADGGTPPRRARTSPSRTTCARCTPTTRNARGSRVTTPPRNSTTRSTRPIRRRRRCASNARLTRRRGRPSPRTCPRRAPTGTPSRSSTAWRRTSPAASTAVRPSPTTTRSTRRSSTRQKC